MIRMLHFADIHIGMENYGRIDPETGLSSRVRDFLRRLDEMIVFAREHDVDLAVFAGDAFKNRQPNPTLQREFAHRIRELSEMCPVVLLVGNHDLPTNILRASSVEIYDTLGVPNVIVGQDYRLHHIETKSGPVQVATAPYPVRAQLLGEDEARGLTIARSDALLQERLQVLLRTLAAEASQSDAPRVLTGHFTVSGATVGSERNVMLGRDISVLLSEIADPAWDYVAMGHIHKHQNMTASREDLPPVVYSGSMESIDFGEQGQAKGFCWVELERGHTVWEFVEVHCRPFVTLYADVRGLSDPTRSVLELINEHELTEAIVRVQIRADTESENSINDKAIEDQLRAAKVSYVAAIQKEIERPSRTRLGDNPEGLTPLELLARYLLARQTSEERIRLLLEHAETIIESNQGPN